MRYFNLEWIDLTVSKQQEMIEAVAESLLELWEEEGKQFLQREWHVKPKDWKEAYCRTYSLDYEYWGDMDENSEEFQKIDWELILQEEAERVSEQRCSEAVRKVEIEVNTGI